MDRLSLLVEALDDAHADHDEGCDCYVRLRDAMLAGVFRFPEVNQDVREPPTVGCETLHEFTMRRMMERIAESFHRDAVLMAGRYAGLRERITPTTTMDAP